MRCLQIVELAQLQLGKNCVLFSIHRQNMKQILLSNGFNKAIMMLDKNKKVNVPSPDRNIDFFSIVAGVPQGDTLAPYLFIICLDCILQISTDQMKENGFTLKEARSIWYPVKTIMDSDYEDDIATLANTPAQAESLLNNLEQAAGSVGLYVNVVKMECMCFNQKWDIYTLNGCSLKLDDKFTYLRSSVSSTENDIKSICD